jgi:hypothetical protein
MSALKQLISEIKHEAVQLLESGSQLTSRHPPRHSTLQHRIRIVSNFRMQAVSANLFAFPA